MMNELPSKHREVWLGRVQLALEQLIDEAPDRACKMFGRNLLDETYRVNENLRNSSWEYKY
jgi:hypothetical protein